MVRSGEVVEKKGELVTVVFERPEACTNCNGCLSKQCINVELPGQAEIGDSVEVSLPDHNVIGASAIAYLIPLAMMLAGLFLGSMLHAALGISMNPDVFTVLCGGVLLGIGLLIVKLIDRHLQGKQSWQPRIIAVHHPDE